jgi:hypothetical protein
MKPSCVWPAQRQNSKGAPIQGLTLSATRAVILYALALVGVPASVWVADPIPDTTLFKKYYEDTKTTCKPSTYHRAKSIADTHIIIATAKHAVSLYEPGATLDALLNAFDDIIAS